MDEYRCKTRILFRAANVHLRLTMAFAELMLIALMAPAATQPMSLSRATSAIASGEDVEPAIARVRRAGKPGLWALHGAAKERQGTERGRLFEAIGHFGTSEAEWALVIELKGDDAAGRAGAVRGLEHVPSASALAAIVRQASANDALVRDAVLDVLSRRVPSQTQLERLASSEDEDSKDVGLKLVVQHGSDALAAAWINPALEHASPRIKHQGVSLVGRVKDRTQIYTLAEIARGPDEHLAAHAVAILGELGGWNVPSELSAVIADASTRDAAWREAAVVLRSLGKEGFTALLRGMSRVREETRRTELAAIAAEGIGEAQLAAAVDLLEDPESREAGAHILDHAGDKGLQAAKQRMESALPELHDAISAYLSRERTASAKRTPPISRR